MPTIAPIDDLPAEAIEALLDAALGSDRKGRTAYRIRSGMPALAEMSVVAMEDGTLVGTLQCWPVALRADDGTEWPLVMVGPVAVVPDRQGDGIGRALMNHVVGYADVNRRVPPLMLIGDPIYYGRFGFSGERTGGWRAPGPVEQHRLLMRGGAMPACAGMLGPRGAANA